MERFNDAVAFTWRPNNDGQSYHVTPGDNGGPTSWGVTERSWLGWVKVMNLPAKALRDATKDDLLPLIKFGYWDVVNADHLPAGVDLLVYEFGYGSGPVTSARVLQELVGVKRIDGVIGPVTLSAAIDAGPGLIDRLAVRHANFYKSLGQPKFVNGWLRRANDRLELARQWAGAKAGPVSLFVPAPATPPQPGKVLRPVEIVDDSAITAALNDRQFALHV